MDPPFVDEGSIHLEIGLDAGFFGFELYEGVLEAVSCLPISDDFAA